MTKLRRRFCLLVLCSSVSALVVFVLWTFEPHGFTRDIFHGALPSTRREDHILKLQIPSKWLESSDTAADTHTNKILDKNHGPDKKRGSDKKRGQGGIITTSGKLRIRQLDNSKTGNSSGSKKHENHTKSESKVKSNDTDLYSDNEMNENMDRQNKSVVKNTSNSRTILNKVTVRPKTCNACFNWTFPLLIDQPDACRVRDNNTVLLIFLIPVPPGAKHRRDAIRRTWGTFTLNNTSPFRRVFVLGSTGAERVSKEVREESLVHRDIVVSDFTDSYTNLTLKTLAALSWATTRCRHARFFVKVDADVWLNVPALARILMRQEPGLQRALIGHCNKKAPLIRNKKSKWYIPSEVYPDPFYPPYCSGTAYAGLMSVAEQILTVAKDIPFFSMEDAYVGMCLQKLGYGVKANYAFLTKPIWDPCKAWSVNVATAHQITPQWMLKFWTQNCTAEETTKRSRKMHLRTKARKQT